MFSDIAVSDVTSTSLKSHQAVGRTQFWGCIFDGVGVCVCVTTQAAPPGFLLATEVRLPRCPKKS